MKNFRTNVSVNGSDFKLIQANKILTMGSCFAEAMGSRFSKYKIETQVNPFGTVYNPHSIHQALRHAVYNEAIPAHSFLENQGIIFSYDFHSSFSGSDKETLFRKLQNTIGSVHYFLKDANWLLITYGTAWVYLRNDTGEIVANCHKMPASLFSKQLLTQKRMLESFEQLYQDLKSFNPHLRIILTVSPVRHIKDTLPLNSVSKSVLRLGCHTLSELFPDVTYFPAYEIMLDDLRDYRFYKPDMIHPSEEAEEFIWEKFIESYLDNNTLEFVQKWKSILEAISHKPFHPNSLQHQLFLKDILKKLEELKSTVNVEKEILDVRSQIIHVE